ncbi:MAG: response regulator, partial [Desulfamplus sp.]|nr:response regulator [Desulfamplus sp.]
SAAIFKGSDNESAGMVVNLTDMSEQIKLELQLRQSHKMESIGRLAGGVAHDFNNMLGVILGHAELALNQSDENLPINKHLEEIRKAAMHSADLTRQLLAFARKQSAVPRVLDLNDTISGMLKMLRRLIGENIDLIWIPGDNLWSVKIDPAQIVQIIVNLIINARDAIADKTGKITIETQNVTLDKTRCAGHEEVLPGQYTMVSINDNGKGMDSKILDNVFEPFFTTKELGKGTGLGLATVYGIVRQNRGIINVYSEPGQGTTFKIYLPMTQEAVMPEKESESDEQTTDIRGNKTILVVEDEEAILELCEDVLKQFGYKVLSANTPLKAIEIVNHYNAPIDLLLTDVVMPEMNGKELREQIEQLKPDIKVLFMSGYTADVIMNRGILGKDIQFLQKPFLINSLVSKVKDALGQSKDLVRE